MIDAVISWVTTTINGWTPLLLAYGAWVWIERLIPAEKDQPANGMVRNMAITFVYLMFSFTAGALVSAKVAGVVARLGGPFFILDGIFPKLLVPFVSVWIFDFFYYWFHRLQHAWSPMWAVHSLHHSDRTLNVTTSIRHHWTEEPLRALLILLPMSLLVKLSPVEAGLIAVAMGQWGYFTHSNVRVPLGPLTWLIAGPQVHRVHHSIEPEHANKNFAAFLPLWDIVFGTYSAPRGWPKTGVTWHDGKASPYEIIFVQRGIAGDSLRTLPHRPRPA